MSQEPAVRVRYAPSPTGALHLGGARTALFNYLFARQQGGSFLLRIEDTDRARFRPGSVEQIQEGLRWLGLEWDEGPDKVGPLGPYIQSQRLPLYHDAARQLIASGAAYRCFCTPDRLERMRAEQRARKEPERYDRQCAAIPVEESERRATSGERFAVRQRLPQQGETTVHDLILGDVSFKNDTLDDHVLLKSDGYPTYHLAFAVDDHAMKVSHVIRGVDWLPSAPKHVLLIEAFGWPLPAFAHLPLVYGRDRQRLSKRHGAKDVLEYRDAGYLPEAIINFVAFLGWSPGTTEEIFTLPELVERFSLAKIQPSPAIANLDRLDWINGQFIRRLSKEELARRLEPFLKVPADRIAPLVPLVQERMRTLDQAKDLLGFFFEDVPPLVVDEPKDGDHMRERVATIRQLLEGLDPWTPATLEPALRGLADQMGLKHGDLFMTLRVALTGRRVTPPLIESMVELGKPRVLKILRERLKS